MRLSQWRCRGSRCLRRQPHTEPAGNQEDIESSRCVRHSTPTVPSASRHLADFLPTPQGSRLGSGFLDIPRASPARAAPLSRTPWLVEAPYTFFFWGRKAVLAMLV